MNKSVKKLLIAISTSGILIFLLCLTNQRRGYIYDPKAEKYITIFRPFSMFWDNTLFIIPYKYEDNREPQENYVQISPGSLNYLSVNWYPSDKFYLKLSSDGVVIKNSLELNVHYDKENSYLNSMDNSHSPKYGHYIIIDVLSQ